jgi:hypothetical protein
VPEGVGEGGAVEVAVAALATCLGHEEAGVAGGPVDRTVGGIGFVVGAHGVGAAQSGSFDGPLQNRAELRCLAEVDEAAKGSFGVGGGCVQEDACHRLGALARGAAIDPLLQRR